MDRKAIAHDTLRIMESGAYTNTKGKTVLIATDQDAAVGQSILYRADAFEDVFRRRDALLPQTGRTTRFEITGETTLQAAARLQTDNERIFCLNFASAKNPGGGFLGGAQAQEESLARSSSLYACIAPMQELYRKNRSLDTCLYTDDMIYSPGVPVFRTDRGDLLDDYYKVSFLTSAAVNAGVIYSQEPHNVDKIDEVMLGRLEKILSVAVVQGYTTLLLGAWGCGVFRNDPEKVAGYFSHFLTGDGLFAQAFGQVTFAIYSAKGMDNRLAFDRKFHF